jgi:non-homologous end joining protein Ku
MTIHPEHALSPKNGRGTSVRLSWGLVQIPVQLHTVVEDKGGSVPPRSTFTADGHPIGNRDYDKVTLENYDGDVVKKVAFGDKWVDLTDEEIAAHSTLTKGIAEIETFIPLATIGTLYAAQRVGAWMPDRMTVGKTKIVDPTAAKASALLRKAMTAQQVAALVLVPTTAGGKYVALLPDGQAVWLAYAANVRPIVDSVVEMDVSDAEMGLATQLIDGIGISSPVLVDRAGELLNTYLAGKAEGTVATVIAVPVAAPVVDLLAQLTASLATVVKPVKKAAAKKAAAKKAAPAKKAS